MSQSIALRVILDVPDGERLTVPASLVAEFGPGQWVVTVSPVGRDGSFIDDASFLAAYAESDEGLYDDLLSGGHAAG